MAADRTVSLIASGPTLPADRGVFVRSTDGNVTPILSPATQVPAGLSLPTLRNLSMAATGEFMFRAGTGLDDDTLFVFAAGQLSVLAQSGQTPPGFRILGGHQIGGGGFLGFAGGKSPCSVDSSTGVERVRCTLEIFSGTGAGIAKVGVPNDLSGQDTSAVNVLVNDQQTLVLGLPANNGEPVLASIHNGAFTTVVTQRQNVPGLGTLSSVQPRAVANNGDVVFDAQVDTNGDGHADDQRVLLYSGGSISTIAVTGEPAGSKIVLAVRGLGIDDSDRVFFQAQFGDPGQASAPISLRVSEGGAVREIAYEGEGFGQDDKGNNLTILQLGQFRIAGNGDIVFRATLGTIQNGTPAASETRILRDAGAGLESLLSTGTDLGGNRKIVSLTIADLNPQGDLLSIASINRSANRALLFLRRQP